MRSADRLRTELHRLDGQGYKSYKDIKGAYAVGDFLLFIDYVQGDPYAAPSQVRVEIPVAVAGFPDWSRSNPVRCVALADFLARAFHVAIGKKGKPDRGSGNSGLITIEAPAQEVLERTAVIIHDDRIEVRFRVGLPAHGRRILGRQAAELLLDDVPAIVEASLRFAVLDAQVLRAHVESVEDQRVLRDALGTRGLVAFIGDGSRLPRRSGVDPRPLEGRVVPFESAPSFAVEVELPNRGVVRGLGVPEGVTLIVGGGYHGKSTVLKAIELGIYDHVPGDGRELVAARPDAVKIRAEDGRRVEHVDISPFIKNLPFGSDTTRFSSDDASGSTSQATNIMEALEVGAGVLLMDEDTSATNFMIRDHRMQALVAKDKEPITPYIDNVRQLYDEKGVSSVIVVGGAGDYFDVADTVIMMDEYRPRDVTAEAKAIAARYAQLRRKEGGEAFGAAPSRFPLPGSIDPSRGKRPVKIDVHDRRAIRFGVWDIDLAALEQLVETSQTRTIGRALHLLKERYLDGGVTLADALDRLEGDVNREGLDVLAEGRDGGLARVRRFEVAAALNRLRSLKVDRDVGEPLRP